MNKESFIIEYLKGKQPSTVNSSHTHELSIETQTTTGDDCAVIHWPGEYDLVVGSDFVRGAGFRLFKLGKLSLRDIGYFLVAANASDLAAMGATPLGFLDVLRYTKEMTTEEIQDILDGILEACSDFKMPLLGGDSGGYELPVLSGTALGVCKKGSALLRRNGQPGDLVYLSDPTGIAGAAILYFCNKCDGALTTSEEQELVDSWRRPRPRLDLGMFLTESGFSTCAMDTSDGLRTSIEQLSEASQLGAVVHIDKIPIPPIVARVAVVRGIVAEEEIYHIVFSDSVDFRLLFTIPSDHHSDFEKEAQSRGFNVHRIGYLTAELDPGEVCAVDANGETIKVPGIGWDQSESPSHERIENLIKQGRNPDGA